MRMTSREFNQDTARAKREAEHGPVFITDRGRPTHVLLTVEAFERMEASGRSLAEMLHYPGADRIDIAFERDRSLPRENQFDFDS